MIPAQNYVIGGEFTFKVYRGDGTLRYQTRPIKNFITSTGLCYPAFVAFADCFRYLTLGSGSGANAITGGAIGWGTTGLDQPLPQYSYIGSRGTYSDPTTSQYDQTCGFTEKNNIVILSRGWRVPTGTGFFSGNYTFNEFMVTPGQPAVTGTDAGFGLTSVCAGADVPGAPWVNQGPTNVYGNEHSYLGLYYKTPTICQLTSAFARIVNAIPVFNGDYLNVHYDLTVRYTTGAQYFNFFLNGNQLLRTNWSGNVGGIANVVHHGIKLINNANLNSVSNPAGGTMQQLDGNYTLSYETGESLTSYWGCPFEPTCPADNTASFSNIVARLTTDDIQFLVNQYVGGGLPAPSGVSSSGVMAWQQTPTAAVRNGWDKRLLDIRSVKYDSTTDNYPDPTNYRNTLDITTDNFPVQALASNRVSRTALSNFVSSGRIRTGQMSFQFRGIDALAANFNNQFIRGMVLSYRDNSNSSSYFIPFLDIIFATTGGNILQSVNTVGLTYTTGLSPYFYLESDANLTLTFNTTWSSPCESGVLGC